MVKLTIKEVGRDTTYRVLEEEEAENFLRKLFKGSEIKKGNKRYIIFKNSKFKAVVYVSLPSEERRPVHRGQIFYADLGKHNELSVQSGIRPVVIVSNYRCNKHSTVISVISLTTQLKTNLPTHIHIKATEENKLNCSSTALCEQIISLPKINLKQKIGELENWQMANIERGLRIQLGLEA